MRKAIISLLVMLGLSMSLFAGTTGTLMGRVKDQDGKPVPYASVFLMQGDANTDHGMNTNDKGAYTLINLPPGEYDVVCQMVGFRPQKITGVQIRVDEVSTVNFQIERTSVKIEGIDVRESKKELVSADKAGSGLTITAESIEGLPVDDIDGIVAMQAGAVQTGGELHIRGGRSNEQTWSVDGMAVSDPVDGGRALTIDLDAVADMKVMTGGLTAEYGNAQSGAVNIVTHSGSPTDYDGKVEYSRNPDINNDIFKAMIGGPIIKNKWTWFANGGYDIYDGRYRNYYNDDPNDAFIYTYSETAEDGSVNTRSRNILKHAGEYPKYDPYEDRDFFDRNYESYNYNIKTMFKFSPTSNFTLAYRGDHSEYRPWSFAWRYAMEHYVEVKQSQQQALATFDQTFASARPANLKLKLGYYRKTYEKGPAGISESDYFRTGGDYAPQYAYDDLGTLITYNLFGFVPIDNDKDNVVDEYWDEDQQAWVRMYDSSEWVYTVQGATDEITVPTFQAPGSMYSEIFNDKTENLQFRTDFEYQYNDIHGFKTGLEIQQHWLEKDRVYEPWAIQSGSFTTYLNDLYDQHLETASLDTTIVHTDIDGNITEWVEVYVNSDIDSIRYTPDGDSTGVRFYSPAAYLEAAEASAGVRDGYQAEPMQVALYLQDQMRWEGMHVNLGLRYDMWYLGKDYKVRKADGSYETREFDSSDRMQHMVSPRLGVTFPISERDVFHFVYNYQYQLPQFQYIFTSKDPSDAAESGETITIGNPRLEPQVTITYEAGVQHQFSEDYVVEIQAYYKNMYNYVNTELYSNPDNQAVKYYRYVSVDYGTSRGIDISLQKTLSEFVSGSVSYGLGWATGNHSEEVTQDENKSLREFPLDWDIRHSFSINTQFRLAKDEESYITPLNIILFPGWVLLDKLVPLSAFGDFNYTLVFNTSSPAPYTMYESTDNSSVDTSDLDPNNGRTEWNHSFDVRLAKKIDLNDNGLGFKLYLDIDNIFDHRNVVSVYNVTGEPDNDGLNGDTDFSEQDWMNDISDDNPSNYGTGREIQFGISFNF